MKHPAYGDIEFVEDKIQYPDYVSNLMHGIRANGGIFRPTTDDWFPNFPGDLVMIAVSPQYERIRSHKFAASEWRIKCWRVVVQGVDCFNSTWSFISEDKDEVIRKYMSIPLIVCRQDLRDMGFKHE